mgnify:CR=1 FL=1
MPAVYRVERQWDLNRENFDGRWLGCSRWFQRSKAGDLNLTEPSDVIEDTCYDISFLDQDTGLWDGSGLKFAPGGTARHPISSKIYNQSGHCWQFTGAGGQSSVQLTAGSKRFAHELNFFQGRSRSMLVLIWIEQDECWRLDAVCAVPFRCGRSTPAEPQRLTDGRPLQQQLAELTGWGGALESLTPGESGLPAAVGAAEPFALERFCRHGITAAFCDGLICSVPETLSTGAFTLEVGCRVAPECFQQLSLIYDEAQRLQRWERRRYQP